MIEDKAKECNGLYRCRLCKKKNEIHDGSYNCRLCSKTKRKIVTDRIGVISVKTKRET